MSTQVGVPTSDRPRISWDLRNQTELAKARRRRTFARSAVGRTELEVAAAKERLSECDKRVADIERLIADGVEGLG